MTLAVSGVALSLVAVSGCCKSSGLIPVSNSATASEGNAFGDAADGKTGGTGEETEKLSREFALDIAETAIIGSWTRMI
ncbi:hypothetical protein HBH89_253750 [Parastagonospora nodorum]|nr:hypothetical protein HBH89_253750 [Parastagonospora nodorum]